MAASPNIVKYSQNSIARFTNYSPLEVFDHVSVALLVALQEGVAGAGVQGRQAG